MKYVKGFDTIRALAVFMVILGHWGYGTQPGSTASRLVNSFIEDGGFGVILFFVLSGFLITSILLNEKYNNTEKKHFVIIKNFFARRVLRIFPIYYLYILIFYFIIQDQFVRDNIGYFITYTSNLLPYRSNQANVISHTWSLAVEEQFYLIWPWLIILSNKKYIKYILVLSIVIGIASKYYVLYVLNRHYPVLVFCCFDSFGIGGLYAYIRMNKDTCRKFERAFLIVFPLLLFIALRITPVGGLPVFVMYVRTMDSVVALALIMFVINNPSEWIRKYVLENKVFNFLGKISYGIYLYHFTFGYGFDVFIRAVGKNNPSLLVLKDNFYLSYCIKLTLLITLCWLSYRFFEQPILRLKKKFEYPKPPVIV